MLPEQLLMSKKPHFTRYTCPNGHPYSVGECTRPCMPCIHRHLCRLLLPVTSQADAAGHLPSSGLWSPHRRRASSECAAWMQALGLQAISSVSASWALRRHGVRTINEDRLLRRGSEIAFARRAELFLRRHRSQPGYIAATSELVDWTSGRLRN